MAIKMDRRSFLKGAAALTASLALSGCEVEWEDGDMGSFDLPTFHVTMESVDVVCGDVLGSDLESIRVVAEFNLKYTGKGIVAASYQDVFRARLGATELDLKTNGTVLATDSLVGQDVTYKVEFEKREKGLYNRYSAGEPLVLTVELQNSQATFFY